MKKEIFILGLGNNTPVTIELAELNGYIVKGLIHYNEDLVGIEKWGYPVIYSNESLFKEAIDNLNFALSMGDNPVRRDLAQKILNSNGKLPVLIHPNSYVSRFAVLEDGVQIHANATIHPHVIVKKNTIISFGSGITHNTTIGENCYIAGHTIIGAYTNIGNNVFIGMGTTSVSGKVEYIGDNVYVGAGSLILTSIADNKKVYGRPAK